MLGKTGTLVVVLGEYFILLESNIVLLYILDTVVNNQNIIFQGSAQTQNPKVPCILSRAERKDKTINKVIKEGTKRYNGIILFKMIGSCISGHAVFMARESYNREF